MPPKKRKLTVTDLSGGSKLSKLPQFAELDKAETLRNDSVSDTENVRKEYGNVTETLRRKSVKSAEKLRKGSVNVTDTSPSRITELLRIKYGKDSVNDEYKKQTVKIPLKKYEKVKAYCKGAGISFQEFITKLIDYFLDEI